jgi:alkylated DNA repair protein (DNA oxidative demethylase)
MDLFDDIESEAVLPLAPGAALLRGFARDDATALLDAVARIATQALFRHLVTPGGHTMSVATTSCGALGWTSDDSGYRYTARDPATGQPWPAMPNELRQLAQDAAALAGFAGFTPDACLVNRYAPGARLTLHQDRNEHDFAAPIVSVSLGVPAVFLFGGIRRSDPTRKLRLAHGDVVVWGGPARLRFHGILPLAHAIHPLTGDCRINLTFRKAGRAGER